MVRKMVRKTLKADACGLDPRLHHDLDRAPDYSPDFTNRVARLSQELESRLQLPVKHEPDMNESVSQMIAIWFNKQCRPLPPRDDRARWRLNTLISSKGPYFAFVVLGLSSADWEKLGLPEPQLYWAPVEDSKIPASLKSFEDQIALVLTAEPLEYLDQSVLSRTVGSKNELGDPATVFEALFGEPC
jgi:hypothetical protein